MNSLRTADCILFFFRRQTSWIEYTAGIQNKFTCEGVCLLILLKPAMIELHRNTAEEYRMINATIPKGSYFGPKKGQYVLFLNPACP